ncbi:methyl-accepting chemotaxis protein [Methylomagnum ishizawai]|uniref:methyl-accepting chemotaxis protein n=1 Tax=Methylomagnum ishizawai TaxID=1760988 RepID=UPI001C337D44|nr:methyl-accepting chemotaxis protein [Methylomagnum ishizawai]BBL77120.1 hypothetical protein MishRS11D_42180 [Methylomagnum ishizawai]
MKVSQQFIGGFSIIALLMAGSLGFGLARMNQIQGRLDHITMNKMPKIEAINRMLTASQEEAIALRNLVISPDPAFDQEMKQRIEGFRAQYDQDEQYLQREVVTERGKELLTQAMGLRKTSRDLNDDLLATGLRSSPEQLWPQLKSARVSHRQWLDTLAAFDKYEVAEAAKAREQAEAAYDSAIFGVSWMGILTMALAVLVGAGLTRNLLRVLGGEPVLATGVASRIAEGDLSTDIVLRPGDTTSLLAAMRRMSETIQRIIQDMNRMSAEHNAGEIDARLEEARFQGAYRTMAEGVNAMVFGHIAVKKKAIACFKSFGEGDMDARIEILPGKQRFINEAIEQVRTNIKALIEDANLLSTAAIEGRLDTKVDPARHQGDYRRIVEGMNRTLRAVAGPVENICRSMASVAEGDLTAAVEGDYQGTFKELQDAINDTLHKLSATLADVDKVATAMATASEQVSATSQSLATASSEQAASVEETSSSMEQMASSINQNKDNAKITDAIAEKTASEATQGGQAVGRTVQAMKEIAGKIGIIDDIAYQTNLLALNAAIEAARAGEHGKGFAVVAAEVRKLAERSQIAAQEIGRLAESSVELAERAGQLLDQIVPSIQKTATLVQDITASSEEQALGAQQIAQAMNQFSKITQQNASASEELSATSEEMHSQAMALQAALRFFTVGDGEDGVPPPRKEPVRRAKARPVARRLEVDDAVFQGEFTRF